MRPSDALIRASFAQECRKTFAGSLSDGQIQAYMPELKHPKKVPLPFRAVAFPLCKVGAGCSFQPELCWHGLCKCKVRFAAQRSKASREKSGAEKETYDSLSLSLSLSFSHSLSLSLSNTRLRLDSLRYRSVLDMRHETPNSAVVESRVLEFTVSCHMHRCWRDLNCKRLVMSASVVVVSNILAGGCRI